MLDGTKNQVDMLLYVKKVCGYGIHVLNNLRIIWVFVTVKYEISVLDYCIMDTDMLLH